MMAAVEAVAATKDRPVLIVTQLNRKDSVVFIYLW